MCWLKTVELIKWIEWSRIKGTDKVLLTPVHSGRIVPRKVERKCVWSVKWLVLGILVSKPKVGKRSRSVDRDVTKVGKTNSNDNEQKSKTLCYNFVPVSINHGLILYCLTHWNKVLQKSWNLHLRLYIHVRKIVGEWE